jgi:hypothetical protein
MPDSSITRFPDSPVTVHKLDAHGRPILSYPGRILVRTESSVTLVATYRGEPLPLGGITLKLGDRFVEHYYCDRWYNIFEIYDGDNGRLRGWYCNITRPATLSEESVAADDLALDLWVEPDGRTVVLDRDEFEALALLPDEREAALASFQELRVLVVAGRLPRTVINNE